MKHAAHGAPKAKKGNDTLFSLFVAHRGSHGAHGAHAASRNVLRGVQNSPVVAASNGAVVELSDDVRERLQALVPQSRRDFRLARLAGERRRLLMLSTSLVALVGTVTATMSFTKINSSDTHAAEFVPEFSAIDDEPSMVSRSSRRESLDANARARAIINNAVDSLEHPYGKHAAPVMTQLQLGTASTASSKADSWNLGSDASFNIAEMSRSAADNPQVALLVDKDAASLPKGFNANHDSGDTGNAYEFSQCTWWVYVRRHQLGLPVGSNFGNGSMWANSARAIGYWVDRTARHVGDIIVFQPHQAGADARYGHVAIVEKINPDGSVETSESGESYRGRTFSRKFSAQQLSQYQFIHY